MFTLIITLIGVWLICFIFGKLFTVKVGTATNKVRSIEYAWQDADIHDGIAR